MPAQLSKELVATVLVEALYTTDDIACARYDISTQSLRRYRRTLPDDLELSAIVATKKLAFDREWAADFPVMLKKGAQVLNECFDAVRGDEKAKKDPQVIAALAGAMKLAADIHLTGRVIDARLADSDRQTDGLSRQASAEAPVYTN